MYLKVRPLTLMKLFFHKILLCNRDTSSSRSFIQAVSSGLWRRVPSLTLCTSDQSVIQTDIKGGQMENNDQLETAQPASHPTVFSFPSVLNLYLFREGSLSTSDHF